MTKLPSSFAAPSSSTQATAQSITIGRASFHAARRRVRAGIGRSHTGDDDPVTVPRSFHLDAAVGEGGKLGKLLIVDPIYLRVGDEHELGAALDAPERARLLVHVEPCREPMLVLAEAVADDAYGHHRRGTKPETEQSGADDR